MKKRSELLCKTICPIANSQEELWQLKSHSGSRWTFPDSFEGIPVGAKPETVFLYTEYLGMVIGVSMHDGANVLSAQIQPGSVALCELPERVFEMARAKWGGAGSAHVICPYLDKYEAQHTVVASQPK